MPKTADPAACPSEATLRDRARAFLIDGLAFATAAAALLYYRPDGLIATAITFAGAYVVALSLWGGVWSISAVLLAFLSTLIYMATLIMALRSLPEMLLSALLPGIAQVYWIWALWPATANLFHPLTLACAAWLVLAAITIFEQNLLVNWRQLAGKLSLRRSRSPPKRIGDLRP